MTPRDVAERPASTRKPYNDTAGYVASRKCYRAHGGWLVVLDRDNGGDWVDGSTRWVLCLMGATGHYGGSLIDLDTKADALAEMKYAAQSDSQPEWLND